MTDSMGPAPALLNDDNQSPDRCSRGHVMKLRPRGRLVGFLLQKEVRAAIMEPATCGPADAASQLPGSSPTGSRRPGESCRSVQSPPGSFSEIDERLGESGRSDRNPMANPSD